MMKKLSGTKSPIALRRVLTTAAVLLLFALVFAAPAAAEGNVAKIDETEYPTLQEAITAAENGNTITLLSNIDFGEYSSNTYAMQNSGNAILFIPTGKNLILEMGEYKISVRETTDGISGYTSLIHIQHGAGLTINGGTLTYDYSAPTADYTGNTVIWTEGTLTTNNAVIKFNASESTQDILSFGVDLRPNLWGVAAGGGYTASYTMNGGSVDCTPECEGIRVANNNGDPYTAMPVTLTINGGTVKGYSAIFVQQLNSIFNPLTVNVNGASSLSGQFAIRIYATSETWTYADATQVTHSINVEEDTATLTSTYSGTSNNIVQLNGITLRCYSADTVDDVKATVIYNGVPMNAVAFVKQGNDVTYYSNLQDAIDAGKTNGVTVIYLNYEITFDANGGEGTMATQTIGRSDDTTAKLTANTFTKEGYVFAGWNTKADGTGTSYADESTTKPTPAEGTTLYAQWIKLVTITFETDGGSTIVPITEVPGTIVPAQEIPTKDGYLFKGWNPVIPEKMPESDLTVTAQWAVKEETNTGNTDATGTPGETEPEVPGELKQESDGKMTFVPDTADAPIVETEDGVTEVTLSSDDGVTIKLKSTTGDVTYGAGNSVTGTFDVIETTIIKPAALKGSEKPVSYGLVIPMDVGTDVPQPAITATFNENIASKVATHEERSYNALAMIQASYSGAGGINAVNEKINGKITVTFTIPSSYGQKLVIFHVEDNKPPVLATILSKTIDGNGDTVITAEGNGFSSYVVAQDTTPTSSGTSTPQGSSVWLTETQTPTPTETAQPTPTDVAPTDIPSTQPTPTQTESPGFGIIGVLAGLGAVAVLRRK